jgi:hypothetical protein
MGYRSEDGSRSRPGSRRQDYYGQPGQPPVSAPHYPAGDWYSSDPDEGNLTDPYGVPGAQMTRDPVRGYPPAPELYPAEGHQRFAADEPQRFHGAPTYDEDVYRDRGHSGGSRFDEDAYERAFSGAGYQDEHDGYADEGHPSGGYPAAGYPGGFPDDDELDSHPRGGGSRGGGGRRKSGGGKGGKPRRPAGRPRRLMSKTTMLSVTAGIVALAVGGTAYMLLASPNGTRNLLAQNAPAGQANTLPSGSSSADADCARQLGTYCHIETRTLDPTPLTLAEVFRTEFENTSDKSSFLEAGQRMDKNCGSAIIGTSLQDAIKSGNCTQVLRASYESADGKIMGTIGVVNLNSTTSAAKAGKAVDANDFISPLSTSRGVTKKLGQGTGVVEAEYKGHYLILMWAEYASLSTPDSHQDHVLEAFEQDLVSGTINIALSERMVTGKPATTAS